MKPWNVLVTGSSGLIGSEAVEYFDRQGHRVTGADNNMRRVFFGPPGDTLWNLERLKGATRQFTPLALDIRDRQYDLVFECRGFRSAQIRHDCVRFAAGILMLQRGVEPIENEGERFIYHRDTPTPARGRLLR